jgi:hypothetical protein
MKEDILEQLVDDYFRSKGYFTMHNVKFRPDKSHPDYIQNQDAVFSDIDLIGYNPRAKGAKRVVVVTCKSWQSGFSIDTVINAIEKDKKIGGKLAWKSFRELVKPKWSEAFCAKIYEQTGSNIFTYFTAVTKLSGARKSWESNTGFLKNLQNNPIQLLSVTEIMTEMSAEIDTTVAPSQIGRLLQVVKASGWLSSSNEKLETPQPKQRYLRLTSVATPASADN